MTTARPLRKKQVKEIVATIQEKFQIAFPLEEYQFYLNSRDKIFILKHSEHLESLNLEFIRTDRMGLYFAEYKNQQIRLSKEGSQLLINEAKKNKQKVKNIVKLDQNEVKQYFLGEDLNKNLNIENTFIFLEYDDNILGCAKYKEQIIINFLPKIHRGEVIL